MISRKILTSSYRFLHLSNICLPLRPTFLATAKMSTSAALYSSTSLKEMNAAPFNSMSDRLDPALLEAVDQMNFQYMTPVQEQVLKNLKPFNKDWLANRCVVI